MSFPSEPTAPSVRPATLSQLVPLAVASAPYRETRPYRTGDAVDLGGIIHAGGSDLLASLAALGRVVDSKPWVVPALSVPPSRIDMVRTLHEYWGGTLFDRLALYPVNQSEYLPGADELKRVAARRVAPTSNILATYVASRLGRSDVFSLLEEKFELARSGSSTKAPRSISTYSRKFSELGVFTARDWKRIASLMLVLSGGTLHDSDCDRLNGWCRKFLRQSFRSAMAGVGWEWVLEKALRVGGYVVSGAGDG